MHRLAPSSHGTTGPNILVIMLRYFLIQNEGKYGVFDMKIIKLVSFRKLKS